MSPSLHRGPHPEDARLFGPAALARLRAAAEEVVWLLDRGYSMNTALGAVGNHHQLELRQRVALGRACASTAQRDLRLGRALAPEALAGRTLHIDGFNLVITLEVALGGGVLVEGCDGCLRDLAGLRGTYRLVEDTATALEHVGAALGALGVGGADWLLDGAVSNSGRLRARILAHPAARGGTGSVELAPDVDRRLTEMSDVVSADSAILERCGSWVNLGAWMVDRFIPGAWVVRLFR